jgi:2-amino-4-hydroxy-6-hydroxymethyldihydropteridine diphosphokinase
MPEALLGFGGNLGNVRQTLDRAVQLLAAERETRLLARSSDYRSAAWGVRDQPDFINLCLIIATDLPPYDLLDRVQAIETRLGRDRRGETRWGPRPVDIDLLAYDDLELASPKLTLPHPRMFERAFVLVPLAEIAPDKIIAGRRVRDALAALDASGIERLSDRDKQL